MVFVFGGSAPSAVLNSEERRSVADRKRRKGTSEGEDCSGAEAIRTRMEDWMEEEGSKGSQNLYKESLMRNMIPSWYDLDDDASGKGGTVSMGFEDVEEPGKGISVDLSDPLCPKFNLDETEKERLLKLFRRTLVVKLLGATPNYEFLKKKFSQMWARTGEIRVFDLPNDFYLVKFRSQEDYDVALTNGPWIVAGSYLSIMRWRADFNPKTEVIDRVVAWVRLPDLPAMHYDKKFLFNLGNVLGKAIKVDIPTAQRGRGKFVRLCVELDLSKPLIPQFYIYDKVQVIEYKCMNLLCLHCGRVGHVRECCEEWVKSQRGRTEGGNKGKEEVSEGVSNTGQEDLGGESRWKIVQKPWRQRRGKAMVVNNLGARLVDGFNGGGSSGSRFSPLVDITNGSKVFEGGGGKERYVKGQAKEGPKQKSPIIQNVNSQHAQRVGSSMRIGGSRRDVMSSRAGSSKGGREEGFENMRGQGEPFKMAVDATEKVCVGLPK